PRGDPVDPAGEVARDVGHRLARAEADLVAGEVDGPAPELDDTDLEGHARPQRGLLEDQRHRPSLQRRAAASRLPALLEIRGEREEGQDLLARQVARGDEMPHALTLASTVSRTSMARRMSADSKMSSAPDSSQSLRRPGR